MERNHLLITISVVCLERNTEVLWGKKREKEAARDARPGLQQLPQSRWMDSRTYLTAMAKNNWDTINKQHLISKTTAKLDWDTEELHHHRVTLKVGKVIQQGQQSKGLTQKDLATKIHKKLQVIVDYESGQAILKNQVLDKIIPEYFLLVPNHSPNSSGRAG
ncbi:hypothetical protein GH733_017916 [Mirounga leonina]|nr:hypothetical protein GH733_017916 [Mirounga leonina]